MLASLSAQCHAIMNKYPEAGTVGHQVLNDIEIPAVCIPAKVGESCEWMTTVNSAEEKRANFRKSLDGKLLFSALYGMYTATLTELKAVSAHTKHSDAVNKTSVESTDQDDRLPGSKETQEA
jgi:hypothetical protein